MPPAICVDNVSKKYLIGRARYSSLRDGLVAGWRRLCGRPAASDTERRRDFWALKDVSFAVEKGTTLGIIGPNGAGKSTLLKLISRVSQPTKGRITTHGRVSALIEVGAGFHPELTGRENVYLNGSILGMTRAEITKKFDAIVDFSGLEEFIDTPVKYYSSGMYARLGFSVAAHVDPDILLVDEVLSVGDWEFQQKCLERMQEVVKGGVTVVFVSHNMTAVSSLCEDVILLHQGRIVMRDAPQSCISHYHASAVTLVSSARRATNSPSDDDSKRVLGTPSVRDEAGAESRAIMTGHSFEMSFPLQFDTATANPVLIIQIRNERSIPVFRTDTKSAGMQLGVRQAREALTVCLRGRMNLLPGSYIIRVFLMAGDGERVIAANDNILSFQVVGNIPAQGIANLDARLGVEEVMAGSQPPLESRDESHLIHDA